VYKESGCKNHNRDRELKLLRDCKKLWTQMDPLFMKYTTCRSVEEEQIKEDAKSALGGEEIFLLGRVSAFGHTVRFNRK